MNKITALFLLFLSARNVKAQDINTVLQKAKAKIETVNDYRASGRMRTNVAFLKVPVANVSVYFKKPDRLKVKSEKGISFIPKGAVNINLSNITGSNKFTVIDAGTDKIDGKTVRIAKLLPLDENSDVILSTVYIDDAASLILKAKTSTRDNGTYELQMSYGKYASYGLPDKIVFSFNAKDYKLPKGVTFDFDDGEPVPEGNSKNKKGRAEIVFSNYIINQGIPDDIFK